MLSGPRPENRACAAILDADESDFGLTITCWIEKDANPIRVRTQPGWDSVQCCRRAGGGLIGDVVDAGSAKLRAFAARRCDATRERLIKRDKRFMSTRNDRRGASGR
jgi:hypothetical protein